MKHPVLKLIFLPNPNIFQPLHNFFPFVLACLSSLFLFPISFNQNLLFLPLSVLGKIFVTLILPFTKPLITVIRRAKTTLTYEDMGGIGVFVCAKKTSVLVFIAFCEFSVFLAFDFLFLDRKNHLWVFGFGIRCGFRFFLFGLLFLLDLSGNYAPPMISHNRESSVCSSRH